MTNENTADSLNNEQAEKPKASVARSTLLMSIATLGSRATGLVRTWAMAFALGNGLITSAYQVANNMPNFIYDLVAGGLLGAAFIPVYLLQKEKLGDKEGNDFACNILNLTIIVLGILSILATIYAPLVIGTQTFTVGNTAEVRVQATMFFRIFAIQIVFYGIGGIITGILNANRVYFLPSLAPALNNVVVIISFFAYVPLSHHDPTLAFIVLAVGTSAGVAVQFIIQIPALIKQGFTYSFKINLRDPALIEAFKIAVPTFIYIIGTLVAFTCRNAYSLVSGDNGPSTLIYAWTWYQLPHGVVAVSLSRALFTEMSEAVAKENWDDLRRHVHSGISGTLLLIIPLAGLMGALSVPIMQLFRAGAFSSEDVKFVAYILSIWVLSMPFYSLVMYLYNVFASMRKFMTFAFVSTIMVAIQIGSYAILSRPWALGLAGIPVGDFIYYCGTCIILLLVLRRRIGDFQLRQSVSTAIRVTIATAIGAGISYLLYTLLPTGNGGMLIGLVQLVICGSIGLVICFGLCKLFRVKEMETFSRYLNAMKQKLNLKKA